MTDNRDVYEKAYSGRNYSRAEGEGFFPRLIQTRLDRLFAQPIASRMLDIGCGNGSFMLPLVKAGYNVTGLDFSPTILKELCARAREEGCELDDSRVVEGDATQLPFADGRFDVAFSFATLYTVPNLDRALSEIARVLTPTGRAFIDLGNRNSLNAIEADRIDNGIALNHLTPEEMEALIAQSGLEIVASRQFQFFPNWGGGTQRAREVLNPVLQNRLGQWNKNHLLIDECIASHPLLRPFAYRWVLELQHRSTSSASQETPDTSPPSGASLSPNWTELRQRAQLLAQGGCPDLALQAFLRLVELDPSDFETAIAIADLFDGPKEQELVSVMKATALSRTTTEPAQAKANQAPATPKISVVLPTFNQRRWLEDAVASILGQTDTDFELIIIDDGSSDGTAEWLRTIRDPRVTTRRQENQGLPSALNAGFSLAKGRYRTWTSSDNVMAPTMLEVLAKALDEDPQAGMVVSHFSWIDEQGRIDRVTRDQDLSYRSLVTLNPGIASFLYRTEIAQEVGEYDAELLGAEDWDMWIRIAERAPLKLVPEVLYHYRFHAKSMTTTLPDQIRDASCRVHQNAIARQGNGFDLERLYPALHEDSEQREIALACCDFATKLSRSPFGCDELAVAFIKEANQRDVDVADTELKDGQLAPDHPLCAMQSTPRALIGQS